MVYRPTDRLELGLRIPPEGVDELLGPDELEHDLRVAGGQSGHGPER